MVEAADAKELIDAAIERAEAAHEGVENAERAAERQFRDRVSILVGVFAVSLAIVHMAAAGAARESLLKAVDASNNFAYMQAKIVRESIFKTSAKLPGVADADRAAWSAEATRLRAPDKAGHGIGQLEEQGKRLREQGEHAAQAGEGYERGETALQLAIVLLSIALVAKSRPVVWGACLMAALGFAAVIATLAGVA